MLEIAHVNPRLYDGISLIVEELMTTVDLEPDNILVVGAD